MMAQIQIEVDSLSEDKFVVDEAYQIIRDLDRRGLSKAVIEDITALAAYLAGQD
jgi:hypothetical protein